MRKKYSAILILTAVFFTKTSSAQSIKNADIAVNITAPQNNVNVPNGDTAFISFNYTNLGPDTLPAGDTLYFATNANVVLYSTLLMDLEPGVSIVMDNSLYITNPTSDLIEGDICIVHVKQSDVMLQGGITPQTTYIDTNTLNDTSCVHLSLLGDDPVGINDVSIASNALKITPNPARDRISMELPQSFSGEMQYMVTDLSGKVILKEKALSSQISNHKLTIDVKKLNAGMYIIYLKSDLFSAHGKFIITH